MSQLWKVLVQACVIALGAACALAPSALATGEPVEAATEPGEVHCGDVTITNHEASGECEIVAHDIQSSHLNEVGVLLSAGSPLSLCHNEFEGYIAENGSGLITHQSLTNTPLGQCFIAPCAEEAGTEPWPFRVTEEVGEETVNVTFCITFGPNNFFCTIDVHIEQTDHHYTFWAEDSPCQEGTGVEVTGEWEGEFLTDQTNTELLH